jgi:hypothetical protein
MSKIKTSERDAAKEALAAMMASASAPGVEQARKAVLQKDDSKELETAQTLQVSVADEIPKSKSPRAIQASKKKLAGTGAGKAEILSISLHPADLDRLEAVETSLRKAGLIGRGSSTSFLLKVTLAAFDPLNVQDLAHAISKISAQDGRRNSNLLS